MDSYIICPCSQKFNEGDFIRHYTKCESFRTYFFDFDKRFGELLKNYSSQQENMFILRILLKQYTVVLERKIKQVFGIDFTQNQNLNHSLKANNHINNDKKEFNNSLEQNNIINDNKQKPFDNNFNKSTSSNKNNYSGSFSNKFMDLDNIEVCQGCGSPNITYYECAHPICFECIMKFINKDLYSVKCLKCNEEVSEFFIKQLIGDEKYKELEMAILYGVHVKNAIICPNNNCKEQIIFETGNVNYNEKDDKGQKMSSKACEDYANQRCRCPTCKTEFCVNCKINPYHIGRSCEEYKIYLNSKKCKYCGVTVNAGNKGPSSECCKHEDCKERYKDSCKKKLKCGHDCPGLATEEICMNCLNSDCKEFNDKFNQDLDSYCNICFTEGLGAAPCVRFDCGHIYHYHCIKSTIEKKWIGPEINLKFCKCSLCQQWLSSSNNNEVNNMIKPYKDLEEKLIKMTEQRLKLEGLDKDKRLNDPNDKYYKKPLEYGLAKIQYYMCFKCKKPYFAGLKECGAQNDRDHNPSDLICGACGSLDGVEGVSECKKHGKDFIEYKCKFCCEISSWFCWGTTHFCESCHAKQCRHEYVTKIPKDKLPKCLGAESCKLKIKHPPNGEEFALGCSLCRNDKANMKDY